MDTHSGRVAVVTGAASGFGAAICSGLARRGADVVAVDLNTAAATVAEVKAVGCRAIGLPADVSDPDAVAAIRDEMIAFGGRVDILVNNAGVFPFKDIFELDFAQWKRSQEITSTRSSSWRRRSSSRCGTVTGAGS
jgi:NAD(P)-dependent dehydrogenase (short-subunit alcohol dehydrogenase family)